MIKFNFTPHFCFPFHKWDDWKKTGIADLYRNSHIANERVLVGEVLFQERVCSNCGLVQKRIERVQV
jgi:hypothetical protein